MIRALFGSACQADVRILVVHVAHDGQANIEGFACQFGLGFARQVGEGDYRLFRVFSAGNVKPSRHLAAWCRMAGSRERGIFGDHGYALFALVDELL